MNTNNEIYISGWMICVFHLKLPQIFIEKHMIYPGYIPHASQCLVLNWVYKPQGPALKDNLSEY